MTFQGIPVNESFFHSNLMVSIILVFIFYICTAFYIERQSGSLKTLGPLFGTATRRLTLQEILRRGILLCFSILGYSLFFATLLKDGGHWEIIGATSGVFAAFLLFKFLVLSVFLSTFFPTSRTLFISLYFTSILIFGIFLFFAFIGLQFMPQFLHLPILIIVAIGVVVLCTWLLITFFKTFFGQSRYIFHFILYLCTLEILPMMVFVKLLWEADILNHVLKL
ncbi:MAG: DUF4271 domain-containing protein [Paludibacteraceae bacterium]|nr:DUF4271 domain-containing protein [Paludibacteraceae bacterium]